MSEEPTQSPDPSREAEQPSTGTSPPEGALASEISRRVTAILDAVEREAEQLRADAHEEARRYLDQACRHADNLIDERRRRIAELSDEIVFKADAVVGKLDDAAPVREGFESLVRGLGDAAERLSSEAERGRPEFDPPAFDEGLAAAEPPPLPPTGYPQSTDQGPIEPRAAPPHPDHARHGPEGPAPAFEARAAPAQDLGAPAWTPTPPPAPPRPPAATPPAAHPPEPTEAGRHGLDEGRLVAMRMAAAGQTRDQVGDHLHNSIGVTDPASILDEVFGAGSAGGARVPWAAYPR
jgi:ElaB/YqjD/DUF883 family membrane-anchored ribosome-binding protein